MADDLENFKDRLKKVNKILQGINSDDFLKKEMPEEVNKKIKELEQELSPQEGLIGTLNNIIKIGCGLTFNEQGKIRKLRFEQLQDTVATTLEIVQSTDTEQCQKIARNFEKRTEKRVNPALEKFKYACYLLVGSVLGLILSPILGPAVGAMLGYNYNRLENEKSQKNLSQSKPTKLKLWGFTLLGMAVGILGAPAVGIAVGIYMGKDKVSHYARFQFAGDPNHPTTDPNVKKQSKNFIHDVNQMRQRGK